MKAYKVKYSSYQYALVIANDMIEAIKKFENKYGSDSIKDIEVFEEEVIV